jgi:UDP-glucose 4-epimerase
VGFEDIQRRVPDISKIKQALNWAPHKTLDNIIDDVVTTI